MKLTPEATAVVEMAAARMPLEMNQIEIQTLRKATSESVPASTTSIYSVTDATARTDSGDVPVRVYRPSDSSYLPVLMWMHGGGYAIGDLNMSDEYLRRLSNAALTIVVSVDYRLAPENPYPAGLDDCMGVWSWLQTGPAEVPADISRLGIGGESAGGSLAFAAALRARDEGGRIPDALVAAYGTAEMTISNPELSTPPLLSARDCTWFWDMYAPDVETRASPYCNVAEATTLRGLGPSLIITAGVDATRDATERFARRMIADGVDATLTRYDGVPHGFLTMLAAIPEASRSFDQIVRFLIANL
ncbi:alpha/beta hydrolase [Rhodococcus erythropolis]